MPARTVQSPATSRDDAPTIHTIGHSTLSLEKFLDILTSNNIQTLADVRRFPGSRRYPHFNVAPLAKALRRAGIEYLPCPQLGGRRRPAPDSDRNAAWRNASFRGYADYMQTPAFRAALDDLQRHARDRATAMMCAEALPWRCHRSLIADALIVRRWRVLDLIGGARPAEHKLTRFAKVRGQRITYPLEDAASPCPPAEIKHQTRTPIGQSQNKR
jgi:uncharacterized protein (DUF488 family)